MVKQDAPHCHAPIHPPAPTPTPVAHPAMTLNIVGPGAITVLVNSMSGCVAGDMSAPCMMPPCVPAGPGVVSKGSGTVLMVGRPAGRSGDVTLHASCVAPIPSPKGSIQSPCSNDVDIGG